MNTPIHAKYLYAENRCLTCGALKEHIEWLLCDEHNALKTPTRSPVGMAPAMSR